MRIESEFYISLETPVFLGFSRTFPKGFMARNYHFGENLLIGLVTGVVR